MNNIFEGAKFGDKFLTRGNRIWLYLGLSRNCYDTIYVLIDENGDKHQFTNSDGCFFQENVKSDWDIISRYQEPVNKDKLDELATKEAKKWYEPVKFESNYDFWRECFECYKAGYRKAKEE